MSILAEETGLAFTVYGRPQQRGSKRPFKSGAATLMVDANDKSKPWMAAVSHAGGEAMQGRELMLGPLAIGVKFHFKRPKSHFGTGRNASVLKASSPYFKESEPDTDKLMRAIGDALTGVVYRDDAQLANVTLSKVYTSEQERAEIFISRL